MTDKEVKEYYDKMGGIFLTLFRYLDEGITQTNAEKARAVIWSDMDDADIKVLVDVMMGAAKTSRIVATAVRQVTKAHQLLQVGIITGPRFMMTFKHYADHGGFLFPWSLGTGGEPNALNP